MHIRMLEFGILFECTKNKTKLLLSTVELRISKEILMKIINYEYAQYEEEKKTLFHRICREL